MSTNPNLCCDETELRSMHSPDGLILGTKEIKDKRTLTFFADSY